MRDGQVLNKSQMGLGLYEITITPKGENKAITVYVYAQSRLDAHNYMITNKHYGTQHQIRCHSTWGLG